MSDDAGAILKAVCDEVIAEACLQPVLDAEGKIIETFCNFGAELVANAMGCGELNDLKADEQYAVMEANASGRWKKVSGSDASIHALSGGLGFASLPSKRLGEPHGHIAAIYPAGMQLSKSLGHDVPMVANVGTQDREERSSQAFPVASGEADYFIWT